MNASEGAKPRLAKMWKHRLNQVGAEAFSVHNLIWIIGFGYFLCVGSLAKNPDSHLSNWVKNQATISHMDFPVKNEGRTQKLSWRSCQVYYGQIAMGKKFPSSTYGHNLCRFFCLEKANEFDKLKPSSNLDIWGCFPLDLEWIGLPTFHFPILIEFEIELKTEVMNSSAPSK